MASTSTRNALKGYGYQGWVYLCLVYKMDLKRFIHKIETEIDFVDSTVRNNFDDIYIEDVDENSFHVQVKNYKNFDIDTVYISENQIKIKGHKPIEYDEDKINIVVTNSIFDCDTEILGIKSKLIDSIYFIPLTKANFELQIGKFYDIKRKDSIGNIINQQIFDEKFYFNQEELPPLNVYPIKLNKKTVLLKNIPKAEEISKGVHWYIGEPGIGKSHIVQEFEENIENLIIYRFHTDNEDIYKKDRLHFNRFLQDISYKLFLESSFKTKGEIIEKLENSDVILIIDGLDHVENYEPNELDNILSFIEQLSNTKTLVFSRPLRNFKPSNSKEIKKWSKDETIYYLKEEYDFEEQFEEIYKITRGYPIITYYLAEHLKNGGDLEDYLMPINNITDYYDKITENIFSKSPMRLFLTVSSYILVDEISELLDDNSSEILLDFIEAYPFLFNKTLNRLSLFHDSFNNYLRNDYELNKSSLKIIKDSILSKDIEYLSRFKSIDFDDDFIKEVLNLYCDFDTFKYLSKNFDFESVKIFYLSLKDILPNFKDVLDIYQYYSFILITFILERNDYLNEGSLFYNLFKYADRKGIDEKQIFSDGVLWSLYVYYRNNDLYLYENILDDTFYDKEDLLNYLKMDWKIEQLWSLDFKNYSMSDEKLRQLIKEVPNKNELFEKYLAYIYVKDIKDSDYYIIITHFIDNNFEEHHKEYFDDICNELAINDYFKPTILENAKIRIFERGYLENENIFLNNDLENFMKSLSSELSCDVYKYLVAYIRLYNHLNLDFNNEEIFKYFNMYFFRKDYSVMNLDDALICFEEHNCLDECTSVKIIKNTMKKSEKGIRSLLTGYLNQKDTNMIIKLLKYWADLEIQVSYLNPELINKIPLNKIFDYLKYRVNDYIYFDDIKGILSSKYCDDLLDYFKFINIVVSDVPKDYESIFDEYSIEYRKLDNIIDERPFENRDYLISTDLENLKEKEVSLLELSTYLDGRHRCLPFVQFFDLYNIEDLNENCLDIIHNAISTKVTFSNEYFCNWYLCLGNIPILLDNIGYDLDWNRLFNVLEDFLEQSGIYWK